MPIKRPYKFKCCPRCGQTKRIVSFGNHKEQLTVKENELPTYYVEYYGCPECGEKWDVEYEISYKIKRIKRRWV